MKSSLKPETRVAVIGGSDFVANSGLGIQGNKDLYMNTIGWLSQQENLISIRAKEPDDRRITLTATQQANIQWLSLLIIPGLIFGSGVYSWWRETLMRGCARRLRYWSCWSVSVRTSASSRGRSRLNQPRSRKRCSWGSTRARSRELKVASDKETSRRSRRKAATGNSSRRSRPKPTNPKCRGIANALGQLEIVRVIDENPTNLNDYGLMTPRIEIDFKATGDKDFRKLSIGEVSDRVRSVRQTQRRQEGVSHPVLPGDNAQPIHIRTARRGGAQVRTRQAWTAWR